MPFTLDPRTGKYTYEGVRPEGLKPLVGDNEELAPLINPAEEVEKAPLLERVLHHHRGGRKGVVDEHRDYWKDGFWRGVVKPFGTKKDWDSPAEAIGMTLGLAKTAVFGNKNHVANTVALGGTQMIANAARWGLDLGEGDYTEKFGGKPGHAIDTLVDSIYKAQGEKPPSEMTESERWGDQARAEFTLQIALAALTWGTSAKIQSPIWLQRAVAPIAAKYPRVYRYLQRAGKIAIVETLASQLADKPTVGSFLGLGGIEPTDTRFEAGLKATIPDIVGALTMAELFNLAGKGAQYAAPRIMRNLDPYAGTAAEYVRGFKHEGHRLWDFIRRGRRSQVSKRRWLKARRWQDEQGFIDLDPDGNGGFTYGVKSKQQPFVETPPPKAQAETPPPKPQVETPAPKTTEVESPPTPQNKEVVKPQTAEETEAALRKKFGLSETDAAFRGQPTPKENAAESDTFQVGLESIADDSDLDEIITRQREGENLVDVADEIISKKPDIQVDEDIQAEAVLAPKKSVEPTHHTDPRLGVSTEKLLSLAYPPNSPGLSGWISGITGKQWAQFDREDVIEGLIRYADHTDQEVLWNRLRSLDAVESINRSKIFALTDDLIVDPARFQSKIQRDSTPFEKWDERQEGKIKVWEDPEDGQTYVVDGHKRLENAKRLGIKSVPIEQVDSKDAIGARNIGTKINIEEETISPIDAATVYRTSDITEPSQIGDSGTAVEAFGLSQLPEKLYKRVISGNLSETKGMALGGSGFSEEEMLLVHKALQVYKPTDSVYADAIRLLKKLNKRSTEEIGSVIPEGFDTPTSLSEIIDNDIIFAPLVQTAKLSVRVKKDLPGEMIQWIDSRQGTEQSAVNSLFSEGVADIMLENRRADVIARRIQRQLTELYKASLSEEAEFQQFKSDPPEKYKEVFQEIDEVTEDLSTRAEKLSQIINDGLKSGDLRPPSSQVPDVPEPKDIDLDKVVEDLSSGQLTDDVLDALEEEIRIGQQFGELDAGIETNKVRSERADNGHDDLTFKEKMASDSVASSIKALKEDEFWIKRRMRLGEELEGKEYPETLEGELEELNDGIKLMEQYSDMPDPMDPFGEPVGMTEQQIFRYENMKKMRDDVLSKINEGKVKQMFIIPKGSGVMSPRYGGATLKFASDFDKAAYIVRANKSGAMPKSTPFLKDLFKKHGTDWAAARLHGDKVHAAIKELVREKTGSASASPDNTSGLEIEIPKQKFGKNLNLSRGGPSLPEIPKQQGSAAPDYTGGKYDLEVNETKLRQKFIQRAQLEKEGKEMELLMEWGGRIEFESAEGLLTQSEAIARETAEAIHEAALIAGVSPERVQFMDLDSVPLTEMFGPEAAAEAAAEWDPVEATWMARNPNDPLFETAAGETLGLKVPDADDMGVYRHSIILALHPALRQRLGGTKLLRSIVFKSGVMPEGLRYPEGGIPMAKVPFHEAFHSVQEWLEDQITWQKVFDIKNIPLDPATAKQLATSDKRYRAYNTPEAIAEMKALLKKYHPKMVAPAIEEASPKELSAETFAVWYTDRKIKIKNGGLKALFERMKKFINNVKRRAREIFGQDPTWVDVFELASSQKLGREKFLNKMTPAQYEGMLERADAEMFERIPELGEQIYNHLLAKKGEYEALVKEFDAVFVKEGC